MSPTSRIVLVWSALLLLLMMTVVASFVLSGTLGLSISLAIACAKAWLIYWFFMHLRQQAGLERVSALAAAAWILILFAFLCLDYFTRIQA